MYKLKKEFKGQNVIVYTPDKKAIRLDNATQEEFAKVLKIKGNEKFIDGAKSTETKKAEPKKVEPKTDKQVKK